jgi:hypothetical protein
MYTRKKTNKKKIGHAIYKGNTKVTFKIKKITQERNIKLLQLGTALLLHIE